MNQHTLAPKPTPKPSQGFAAYDVAFLGHYTKDTIVSPAGIRVVDGGAFNYGAHVAARMGLNVAAITCLAKEDFHVVDELIALGVDVFARETPQSTCLRLEYPTSNVDQRVIYVESTAGPFTPADVEPLQAAGGWQTSGGRHPRAILVGASMRGEVSLPVIEALSRKGTFGREPSDGRFPSALAIDVQGFVRVARQGKLVYEPWPEKQQVLAHVDVLKADAVEAEMLTGETDLRAAARMLSDLGPGEIVLTHRDGVLVYADEQFYEAAFVPRELVGRSGRGDTCIAAYVARRLTASPAEATAWAAAVTSLKMEAEGPFLKEISDVEDLVGKEYKEM
jgi:sugar/nucleoside kinase (ribokinase family)